MRRPLATLLYVSILAVPAAVSAAEPLRLHPDNPHYFEFRGRPTVLITSGEHYGAVLNLDFDYVPYLDELAKHKLNLTRTFSGTYLEGPVTFSIRKNTLGPAPGRYCAPWARTSTPGAADGGNKFDLNRFDPAYFTRLKDFLSEAGKRGIVVELVLFGVVYNEELWSINALNPANHVNRTGPMRRDRIYTLDNGGLFAIQEAFVRKVAAELRDFDNVYFEIINEPYVPGTGVTEEWQNRIIAAIVDAEASSPSRHLIAKNIANGSERIEKPNPHVSIFNFHYSRPPDSVTWNYGLQKAIGDDETGFDGLADSAYRTEAWDFLIAGGAVFSNLDYSFTADEEDGTAAPDAPGGGGATLRAQLRILKEFMEGFDLVRMRPEPDALAAYSIGGGSPAGGSVRVLAHAGNAYAIYVRGGNRVDLSLNLPAGSFRVEWVNTKTGRVDLGENLQHAGGQKRLTSPPYVEDIALRVRRAS